MNPQKAADDTAAITGGHLDYLIANAAYVTNFDSFDPIDVLYVNYPVLLSASNTGNR